MYAISQTNFMLLEATVSGAFCDPPFSRFYFWTCHSTFWRRWQSSQKVIVQSLVGNDYYYFHQAYHINFTMESVTLLSWGENTFTSLLWLLFHCYKNWGFFST